MIADFLCQLIYWIEWCFIAYKLSLGFSILAFHLLGELYKLRYRTRILQSFISWFIFCYIQQGGFAVG